LSKNATNKPVWLVPKPPVFWDTNTEISEIKNKIAKSIENKGILAIFYSYEFND
jgi:hypothetical protein